MFLYRKLCFVSALLFLSVGMALAQTTITGTVYSADDNEPMIGANVLVEGTQNRAITDSAASAQSVFFRYILGSS